MLAIYEKDGLAAALSEGRRSLGGRDEAGPGAQCLLKLADGVLRKSASRDDIFGAYRFATEVAPEAVEGWYALGRVNAFVNNFAEAATALGKARALAPSHDLVRRMHEAYQRLASEALAK